MLSSVFEIHGLKIVTLLSCFNHYFIFLASEGLYGAVSLGLVIWFRFGFGFWILGFWFYLVGFGIAGWPAGRLEIVCLKGICWTQVHKSVQMLVKRRNYLVKWVYELCSFLFLNAVFHILAGLACA
jgi:hypothetical protein